MALEILSLLCTFEISTERRILSFDSNLFQNSYKVYSLFSHQSTQDKLPLRVQNLVWSI